MSSNLEKAKAVFLEVIENCKPDQWNGYLDEACGEDADLRQTVEELLHAHSHGASRFDKGAIIASPVIDNAIGTRIGPYKLLHEVGEGGMGVVYVAEQTEPVQRRVALKIVKPGMDTRQVIARFEAERQALSLMDHPHIAKVFDAGATDGGRPYFVMELVKGVALNEYCDQYRLSLKERLKLFISVCQAVQHAHQKGVIHRDLKPSNILVAVFDGNPVPKIIDFGVAKAISQQLTEKTIFTETGQIVGTLEYMSPEQAQLTRLDVDTRSDIYSLGAVLYELLSGSTPFDQKRLCSAAFDDLLRIIREEEPPKPSVRLSTNDKLASIAAVRKTEPTKLNALISGDLDWLVMKCLEKDRERRYATANDLAADIRCYLEDKPVVAGPPSVTYRLQKFARRNKTLLRWSATISAILVVATVFSVGQAIRATLAELRATSERDAANIARASESEARSRAELDQKRVRRLLYIAHMRAVKDAWDQSDIDRAVTLLERHRPEQGQEDLRGFEWQFYWRLCHLAHHEVDLSESFTACAFAPDMSSLILGTGQLDNEGKIKFIDLLTGHVTKQIAHSIRFESLRVDIVGKATTRKYIDGASPHVESLSLSPDGKMIAAVNKTGLYLWNIDDGSKVNLPVDLDASVSPGAVFSPDSTLLAFCVQPDSRLDSYSYLTSDAIPPPRVQNEKRLFVLDVRTNRITRTDLAYSSSWPHVAFAPDGKSLAVARGSLDKPNDLCIADVTSGEILKTVPVANGPVTALAFSVDGSVLASAESDNVIRFWSYPAGSEKGSVKGHHKPISQISFSPNGRLVASLSGDNTIRFWNVDTLQQVHVIRGPVRSFAFTQSGQEIVTVGSKIKHWKIDGLNEYEIIGTHKDKSNPLASSCRSVLFSQDSEVLASASWAGDVKRWTVETGQLLETVQVHERTISKIALIPTTGALVTAGGQLGSLVRDSELRICDFKSGEVIHKYAGNPGDTVDDLAYSPDGTILVAGTMRRGGTLFHWDLRSDRQFGSALERSSVAGDTEVKRVEYSKDGRFVLYVSTQIKRSEQSKVPVIKYEVVVWDVASNKRKMRLEHDNMHVAVARFSPNVDWIVTGGAGGVVRMWNAQTGTLVKSFEIGFRINSVQWLDNSTLIVAGGNIPKGGESKTSGRIVVLNLKSSEVITDFEDCGSLITTTAAYGDGKLLAASHFNSTRITLWHTSSQRPLCTLDAKNKDVISCLAFSPDGLTLASNDSGGDLILWDVTKRVERQRIKPGLDGNRYKVKFSPDNRTLAMSAFKRVDLWDISSSRIYRSLRQPSFGSSVREIAVSVDGRTAITAGSDSKSVELNKWNLETGQFKSLEHVGEINSVAFSPDGQYFATGGGNANNAGELFIWDAQSDKKRALAGHPRAILSVRFSIDGSILASGSSDRTVRLWNVETGELLATLGGHAGPVSSIAFAPDKTTLAAASGATTSGQIKLWDIPTFEERSTLTGHDANIHSIAFSSDGQTVATGGGDGKVILWRTQ